MTADGSRGPGQDRRGSGHGGTGSGALQLAAAVGRAESVQCHSLFLQQTPAVCLPAGEAVSELCYSVFDPGRKQPALHSLTVARRGRCERLPAETSGGDRSTRSFMHSFGCSVYQRVLKRGLFIAKPCEPPIAVLGAGHAAVDSSAVLLRTAFSSVSISRNGFGGSTIALGNGWPCSMYMYAAAHPPGDWSGWRRQRPRRGGVPGPQAKPACAHDPKGMKAFALITIRVASHYLKA